MEELNVKFTTDICEKNMSFKWSIHNIQRIPNVVTSSRFALIDGENKDFYAVATLLPNGLFKVGLVYDAENIVPIRIEHFSRATDSRGRALGGISSSLVLFHERGEMVFLDNIRLPDMEQPHKLLQDDATFECAMKIYGCGLVTTSEVLSQIDAPDMGVIEFQNDYRHLMSDEEYTDLVICTSEGRCFKVHQCVFRYRAPKFYEEHLDDIERDGRVELENTSSSIFKSLLCYIYTGEAGQLRKPDDYHNLYTEAYTYNLRGLQRFCAKVLARNLSVDTLVDTYETADFYQDEELIMQCKIFMRGHLELLSKNKGWNQLIAAKPYLMDKVEKIRH